MTDREKLIELLVEAEKEWFVPMWVPPNERLHCMLVQIADCLLANGVTFATDTNVGGKWIPVTERLPEKKGEYLVAFHPCYWDDVKLDKTVVGVDSFRGKATWAKNKFQRVTHWMPLPEPPKGE